MIDKELAYEFEGICRHYRKYGYKQEYRKAHKAKFVKGKLVLRLYVNVSKRRIYTSIKSL